MDFKRVKIVTFVPVADADKVRRAIGGAGGGQIGEYSFCRFTLHSRCYFAILPEVGARSSAD